MGKSVICNKVIEEIKLIPENKLSELYDFIHYFRIGLQKSKGNKEQVMSFAGCWQDMSDEVFNGFLDEIRQRRKQAFSGRRNDETGIN